MKKTLLGALPAMAVVFTALWLGSQAFRFKTAGPPEVYKEVAKVACMDGGRAMPLDSFARTRLSMLSERTEVFQWDADRQEAVFSCSAIEWLLDTMDQPLLSSGPGSRHQVFRIDNDQLLDFLKLKPRPSFLRYSLDDLDPVLDKVYSQYRIAKAKTPQQATLFDEKLMELRNRIEQYKELVFNGKPQFFPPQDKTGVWATLLEMDRKIEPTAEERAVLKQAQDVLIDKKAQELQAKFPNPDKIPEEIREIINDQISDKLEQMLAEMKPAMRERVDSAVADVGRMAKQQRKRDYEGLRETAAKFITFQESRMEPNTIRRVRFEALFNLLSPFYNCIFIYLFSSILVLLSWQFGRVECLTKTALALTVLTFGYHTVALIARMYIQNRPPVTNLYSSAVFIGWGAVLLTLVLYRLTGKSEIPLIAGNFIGAATLKIAHMLANDGDTLGVLQAVLDTNFWLSIHVTTVTIGYTITYMASILAAIYIVWGIFGSTLNETWNKKLGGQMYGTICAATLFSFFGTVAGGIWADESWGRFWGWDPKENGAVLVVLWNAMILHARWCGLVKQRGIAVLCVVGGMITTWSWFGTNQLGIGLHAYGFKKDLVDLCRNIWLVSIGLIALGSIPMRFWRSSPYGTR